MKMRKKESYNQEETRARFHFIQIENITFSHNRSPYVLRPKAT